MTTNQLKYFITAAECLNFTEAGRRHYISQTAITQHIQALEEQLDVKLFVREKKRVHLTPAGEIFYAEAKALLLLVYAGIGITILPESVVRTHANTVDVAFVPLEGAHEYVDVLAIWREDSPNPVTSVFRDHVIAATSEAEKMQGPL